MNPYTIIIPIHNAFEHVKRCLESVLRNTPEPHEIFACDDHSTDPRVVEYLKSIKREGFIPSFFIIKGDPVGFVQNVNTGFKNFISGDNDVIVLNSDTVVPPGWIDRLDAARHFGDRKVAAVCPTSNNATIFSVPYNSIHAPEFTDETDALVCQYSDHAYPTIPTVNGFCMLLTREAINEIGKFDEIFGRGYGEEVDWCQRAIAAGYCCVLCDDLFVYHAGRASFGDERKALIERAEPIVLERWPNYRDDVITWVKQDHLRRLKTRLMYGRRGESRDTLKVCHIQHSYGPRGGVENLTRWLIDAMEDVESTVIVPQQCASIDEPAMSSFEGSTFVTRINRQLLESDYSFRGIPVQSEVPSAMGEPVSKALEVTRPDIVQINHFAFWGHSQLIERAQALGAKVVLTVHDDFLLCPRLKDIDCGQSDARGPGCANCLLGVAASRRYVGLDEVEEYLSIRYGAVRESLDKVDAIVVPSAVMRERFDAVHPGIGEKIRVIQNGIPVPIFNRVRHSGSTLRVGFVGTCTNHKGFEFIRRVVEACTWLVEWHVFGAVDPDLDLKGLEKVKFRGAYEPEKLAQLLQDVDVAVPMLAHNEAYGLVVDECLAAGVATALPDLPVVAERVAGSVLYKFGDAHSLVDNLRSIFASRGMVTSNVRSIEQCAADYVELYRELVDGCRS